jgi:hypothetical protein
VTPPIIAFRSKSAYFSDNGYVGHKPTPGTPGLHLSKYVNPAEIPSHPEKAGASDMNGIATGIDARKAGCAPIPQRAAHRLAFAFVSH